MTDRKVTAHFVTFYSPGSFVAEETTKPIASWDIEAAKKMARTVSERYASKPYGFQFTTRSRGPKDLDSKEEQAQSALLFGRKGRNTGSGKSAGHREGRNSHQQHGRQRMGPRDYERQFVANMPSAHADRRGVGVEVMTDKPASPSTPAPSGRLEESPEDVAHQFLEAGADSVHVVSFDYLSLLPVVTPADAPPAVESRLKVGYLIVDIHYGPNTHHHLEGPMGLNPSGIGRICEAVNTELDRHEGTRSRGAGAAPEEPKE